MLDLGTKNSQSSALGGGQVGQGMAGVPAHSTARAAPFIHEERGHHGTKPGAPQGSGRSRAALRRTGHFAFHAGTTLHLHQRGHFKGQESRMELVKGQPGTVTLQKRHKGHVRAKKQEGRRGRKKKREIQKCTHCSDRNIQFTFLGEMSSCTAHGEDTGSQGRKAPHLAR